MRLFDGRLRGTAATSRFSLARFPYLRAAVAEEAAPVEEVWIPIPHGVRLAADVHWPTDRSAADRFSVLLLYSPCRKQESHSASPSWSSCFLASGYLVMRVDTRDSGCGAGVTIPCEYSDIELDDGDVVIDGLSKQPWSTGKVGVFGLSWTGFNAIEMALRNPPALERGGEERGGEERGADPGEAVTRDRNPP